MCFQNGESQEGVGGDACLICDSSRDRRNWSIVSGCEDSAPATPTGPTTPTSPTPPAGPTTPTELNPPTASPPTTTSRDTDSLTAAQDDDDGLSGGAIAGIVIGCLVAAVATATVLARKVGLTNATKNVEFDSGTPEFKAHSEAVRNETGQDDSGAV